ncbi:hypothetical protein [Lysinibacillus parviboronicapiens]|nr:hypothetical protein [Lysinibacillus parviboronicapiens]
MAYSKAIERLSKQSINSASIDETGNRECLVSFYNWGNKRISRP